MSDLLRMTGMYSGMDTESIIQQLVSAKATKVTNLKNDQKKLEWKQTLWQDLNKRIYKLYTGTLSNMRLTGSYSKKKVHDFRSHQGYDRSGRRGCQWCAVARGQEDCQVRIFDRSCGFQEIIKGYKGYDAV